MNKDRFQFVPVVVVVLFMMLGLAGCRTFQIETDWDADVDFSEFRRFYWQEPVPVPDSDPFADNSLLRKRLRVAVEAVMAERGFIQVDKLGEADFVLTHRVLLDSRLDVNGIASSIDAGLYNRRGNWGSGYSSTRVRRSQESVLILDLVAPESGDLLWRGWGTGLIQTRDRVRDRDRGKKRLQDGVRAILDEFPPAPDA